MNCKTIVEDLQDIIKFKRTISVHKSLREMIMCNAIRFQQGEPQTGLSQRDEYVSLSLSLNWVNVTLLAPDVLQYPTTVSSDL